MFNFLGKTVFLTGAASGIGKETAQAFIDNGAKVALIDVNKYALQDLKESLSDKQDQVMTLTVDISESTQVDKAVAEVMEWSKQIDILVNSAGIFKQAMLLDMTDEFFDQTLKINLYGVFYCCRSVAREMVKNQYGKIVNFSSIAGQQGSKANCHYAATKRGVEGLSKSIALELAPYNINVNCIAPGIIVTPIFDEKILEERSATWLTGIPAGRFGQPIDIANTVMFLCSDNSSYITGATIDVNGGMVIR